jgi:hypothetical protein
LVFRLLQLNPAVRCTKRHCSKIHVATLEWHMISRKFGMTAADLGLLQEKSVEVLELLKANLPEKNEVINAGNSRRRTRTKWTSSKATLRPFCVSARTHARGIMISSTWLLFTSSLRQHTRR